MSPSTKSTKTEAPAEVVEVENPLDQFTGRLVTVESISYSSDFRAILSKVIFGEVIGAMVEALNESYPALKDDAPKSEVSARRDLIRADVGRFIADKTGRFYTWSNLDAWRKAGLVNATLPEAIRVTMTEHESGDPALAILSGKFSVWSLVYLGQIEDEKVRASSAEALVAASTGDRVSEESAKAEADRVNGKTPTPVAPKAAADMTEALVKSFRKREAGTVGKVEHIMLTVDEDDAATLADFGRKLWSMTKADAGEPDKDKRNRKRVEVFSAAVEELLFGGEAAEDDGAEDGAEPVL